MVLADIYDDGKLPQVVAPGYFGQGPALLIPRQTDVLAWLEALASAMEVADQAEAMLMQLDGLAMDTSSHSLSAFKDAMELLAEALDRAFATRNGVALNAALRHSDMFLGWVRLRNGDGTPRRPKVDDYADEEWKRLCESLVVIQPRQAGWDLDPLRLLVADWLSARDSNAFSDLWRSAEDPRDTEFHTSMVRFVIAMQALVASLQVDCRMVERLMDAGLTRVQVHRFFSIIEAWMQINASPHHPLSYIQTETQSKWIDEFHSCKRSPLAIYLAQDQPAHVSEEAWQALELAQRLQSDIVERFASKLQRSYSILFLFDDDPGTNSSRSSDDDYSSEDEEEEDDDEPSEFVD